MIQVYFEGSFKEGSVLKTDPIFMRNLCFRSLTALGDVSSSGTLGKSRNDHRMNDLRSWRLWSKADMIHFPKAKLNVVCILKVLIHVDHAFAEKSSLRWFDWLATSTV